MRTIFAFSLFQYLLEPFFWILNFSIAVALIIAPAFSASFSFEHQEQSSLDTVQASLFLGALIFCIKTAYSLLHDELKNRVAMTLFTRPISRGQVLFAKFSAIISMLAILCLLQAFLIHYQGKYFMWSEHTHWLSVCAILSVFLQGSILLALSLTLSLYFSPAIGLFLSFALLLSSYALPINALIPLSFIFPALPIMDLSRLAYSGEMFKIQHLFAQIAYAFFFCSFCLLLATKKLDKLEF